MKCTFCGDEINKGEGKIFVKSNGTSYFYCSSKCEKNHLKLRRDPRKVEWVRRE